MGLPACPSEVRHHARGGLIAVAVIALTLPTASAATKPGTFAVANAAPGLVAAYSMDAGAGTTLPDDGGNGNNGVIAGPIWTDGKYGGALSFDGIDDWVTIPDAPSLDLSAALTIEAWVKPSSLPTFWKTVVMKEQPANLTYGLFADSD